MQKRSDLSINLIEWLSFWIKGKIRQNKASCPTQCTHIIWKICYSCWKWLPSSFLHLKRIIRQKQWLGKQCLYHMSINDLKSGFLTRDYIFQKQMLDESGTRKLLLCTLQSGAQAAQLHCTSSPLLAPSIKPACSPHLVYLLTVFS